MISHNQSDAAYLVVLEARLRTGVYTFLDNKETNKQVINGPIAIIAKIIKLQWHPQQKLKYQHYT